MSKPIYQKFLGSWVLDVDTCTYEQGDPPKSATYRIAEDGDELVFDMDWIDADGETHHVSFRARPDGSPIPFNGGDLADSLVVSAPSENELCSSALRGGVELMTAERKLLGDDAVMDLMQRVYLPDGTSPTNRSKFHRQQ
ncbi:MAG: hypothetical protein K0U74_04405 [Alphaproteobacteria bacterium]|nr:hypothetical protein [Alphaproteobacteria bacterium]